MKLLIAEDNMLTQTMLSEVVSQWGYDVIAVGDGAAVQQLIQADDAPQLLLLDRDIPKMSGIDVCEYIRSLESNDPPYIILLGDRDDTSDVVEAFSKGANDYILKPFDDAELKVRLHAGKSMLKLQDELLKANDLLSVEKGIIEDTILTMRSTLHFDQFQLRCLQLSVEKTSGDVLFSAHRPDNAQHIMLGDFTGHGLTAALGGPLASDTFYSMTAKGLSMSMIAEEINHHMCEKMPVGLFLGAIMMEVNPERTEIRVWNCGMEDVLFFREQSLIETIPSTNLALGIVDQPIENTSVFVIEPDDLFYAYSDGLTETKNDHGEMFGQERLVQTITDMLASKAEIEQLADTVVAYRCEIEQRDDMTLFELKC